MTKGPVLLTVPPMTVLSTLLVAGLLSPVTMDSSTCERPSTTFPSAGIFAPATTCTGTSSQNKLCAIVSAADECTSGSYGAELTLGTIIRCLAVMPVPFRLLSFSRMLCHSHQVQRQRT